MSERSQAARLTRALTEFIVIVVGVLVALAVDSWNTARDDREMEHAYLEALARDLRSDSAAIENVFLPAIAQKDSALAVLAPIVRGVVGVPTDTLSFLRLASLGGRLGGTVTLTLSPTYKELINSGRLHLIESASLRSSIVVHYGRVDVLRGRMAERVGGYPMVIHQFFPAELRGQETENDIRDFDVERAVDGIRSESFVKLMNQEINSLYFMKPRMIEFREATLGLLNLVDAELGR